MRLDSNLQVKDAHPEWQRLHDSALSEQARAIPPAPLVLGAKVAYPYPKCHWYNATPELTCAVPSNTRSVLGAGLPTRRHSLIRPYDVQITL